MGSVLLLTSPGTGLPAHFRKCQEAKKFPQNFSAAQGPEHGPYPLYKVKGASSGNKTDAI